MLYKTIFQFILHDCETHILDFKGMEKTVSVKNEVVTKIIRITGMKE